MADTDGALTPTVIISTLSLAVALSSLFYSIWADRYKYRGQPEVYFERGAQALILIIINHHLYTIQLRGLFQVGKHSNHPQIIRDGIYGRKTFPFLLDSEERAEISLDLSRLESEILLLKVASGRVDRRGRLREHSVKIRVDR